MNASLAVRRLFWFVLALALNASADSFNSRLLLQDDFNALPPGMFSAGVIGAHIEYHYLPEAAPKGNWAVSCFKNEGSQRAWRVIGEPGSRVMYQSYLTTTNDRAYTHSILIAGDELWQDYSVTVSFSPELTEGKNGVLFRYHNDRCYYFFGVEEKSVVLKKVKHERALHEADETILARKDFDWKPNDRFTAKVTVRGRHIRAQLNDNLTLEADDDTFAAGKIGLLADAPTRFYSVQVATSKKDERLFLKRRAERKHDLAALQAANPKMVLWKKIRTDGFGVGRNLRFGDLEGDGRMDILIGQVRHHGPKDRNSELSCLTALTLDGKKLWQIGEPNAWNDNLTSDVAFQIHDLDGDGSNEVVYCMNLELIVADGTTGRTKYKSPTPETPANNQPPYNRFPRILGDCLFFCDLSGKGRKSDIIIKDRYHYIWAFNEKLEPLWKAECNTGHYPFACDIDGDGKDELAIGYSLYDHDGNQLWTLDKQLADHADGVAIVKFGAETNSPFRFFCAASDEGAFFADLQGRILKHHRVGHVQNPAIADFRPDLPGLETVTINFWGNQGIIHIFGADGEIIDDFEPCQHGSMMLPINWTGRPGEYFVLSASVLEGGLFDGRGRRAVEFPNDGHPEMCSAVIDLTGDCRDEIVTWDPWEIWIYTQSDNPKPGKLYKPGRNPLFNYSNYQTTVSLPGWSE
jgi:rhamnogalacturonan endolyase